MTITQSELKRRLNYDPETGIFIHLQNHRADLIGKEVGCKCKKGYLWTKINRKSYSLHRLAFLYMEGVFPKDMVDHINRNKSDNRWSNLRHADRYLNRANRDVDANSKTGITGVSFNNNTYQVKCKRKYYFATQDFELACFVNELVREKNKCLVPEVS